MYIDLLIVCLILLWIIAGIIAFSYFSKRGWNWSNWRTIDTAVLTVFIIFGVPGLMVVAFIHGNHRSPNLRA